MDSRIKKILIDIHENLYKKDFDASLNIFLCGANPSNRKSLRTRIDAAIKSNSKFNIIFPEFLFSNKIYTGNFNLLKLEHKLSTDVDVVIIPIEGWGTICELGAFSSNEIILKKLIVINDEKHSSNACNSFINIGPLGLVRKNNHENLITYKNINEQAIIDKLEGRLKFWRKKSNNNLLNNIFNLSRFILYIIALFQPVSIKKMKLLLKGFDVEKIEKSFVDASTKNLLQKDLINRDLEYPSCKEVFFLSNLGHDYVFEKLIPRLKLKKAYTKIRTEIIDYELKPVKLNMEKELKFLEL